jgi:hypothetical protein
MEEPLDQLQTTRHHKINHRQMEPRKDKDITTRAIRTMQVISHQKGTLPQ